jgi:hypothetical protein
MINSRELLIKFSKLIGIPESEARSGFEIFVRQISKQMSPGDEIEVESLGFFAYKKVKPDASYYNHYQHVIIFSTERISQSSNNILLFFLPDESKKEFPYIDSYLSLSLGKPLINSIKGIDEELFLQFSSNETIGLIDSKVEKLISNVKIYKSSNIENQEFVITPKQEREVIFDTGIENESVEEIEEVESDNEPDTQITIEEKKITKNFDDFELVESFDVKLDDSEIKSKLFFDDLKFQDELAEQKENVETKDGYTEVTDAILESSISSPTLTHSDSKKADLTRSEFGPKKKRRKRLVFAMLALLFILSASIGVYLNYDKAKDLIDKYVGNESSVTATKERITPKIISRTYEIPVSFPYEKGKLFTSSIEDSVLISPAVYTVMKNLSDIGGSEAEFDQNTAAVNTSELLKVGENLYKRGSEFLVQVSSWKSKSKADKELNKYIENGFHAELIEETSSGLGKYHRIIVGGFNSIEEANSFLNKNK